MLDVHDRSSDLHSAPSCADVLSDVMRSVRLTGSMLFLVDATTPWMSWAPQAEAFRRIVLPASQHMVSYHVVTQGRCWGGLRDASPECFEAGDVLVVPHGDAYFLANPADARASQGPGEVVSFFRQMAAGRLPSTLNEGGGGSQRTQFICGFLGCDRRPFNPVLAALPPMIHLHSATSSPDRMHYLIEFALCELRERSTGGQAVLTRLAELMFIEVLRCHLQTMAATQPGWLAGLNDPLVARALALLHGAPVRRWTLDELAARAGASRSVLAERFSQSVGQPPILYLTQWRMQLAGRMLLEPGAKIAAVAAAVGYESEAAFSRAFKRIAGVAPSVWRLEGPAATVRAPDIPVI